MQFEMRATWLGGVMGILAVMTAPSRRTRVLVGCLAVLVAVAVAFGIARSERGGILGHETSGIAFLTHDGSEATSDLVRYEGILEVGADGCLYFERKDTQERFRAVLREGVAVSPLGVTISDGTFFAFGDELSTGREQAPYWDESARDLNCDGPTGLWGLWL